MRKYNEALKGMVDNYRDKAKTENIPTNHLSDEEMFRIIEYWSGMSKSG